MNENFYEKLKTKMNVKQIVMVVAMVLSIIATCFGVSKYVVNKDLTEEVDFNEYRIQTAEIAQQMLGVQEDQQYTGEGVKVTITSVAMDEANLGKDNVTEEDKNKLMTIQYFPGELNADGTAGEDDNGWIEYSNDGFVVTDNTKINVRLMCKEDNFYGPVTTIDITNIAVARIQTGNEGEPDEYTYYRTLAEAIEESTQIGGSNPIVIEMVANTTESVNIPEGANIKLDLNGYTITSATENAGAGEGESPTIGTVGQGGEVGTAITVNGTLEIISTKTSEPTSQNGEVISTVGPAIKVNNGGILTLGEDDEENNEPNVNKENPIITGNTNGVVIEEGGKLNFYDGEIKGKTNAIVDGNKDKNNIQIDTPENYDIAISREGEYEIAKNSKKYKVTANANEGTITNLNGWQNLSQDNKTADKMIMPSKEYGELPVAEREGYTFNNWTEGNILDNVTLTNQYITGNTPTTLGTSDGNNKVSDFIEVEEGKTYRFTLSHNQTTMQDWYGYMWFSEPNLTSRVGTRIAQTVSSYDGFTITLTAPAGAKYLRIGARHMNVGGNQGGVEITFANYFLGEVIDASTIFEYEQDTTIIPQWSANKYTIKFNTNVTAEEGTVTGTMTQTACTYDQTIKLPQNTYERAGYNFKGWVTEQTLTNLNNGTITLEQAISQAYADQAELDINLANENGATVNLYALWKDETPPTNDAPDTTSQTSSITATFKQTDLGSGINPSTIKFQIGQDLNGNGTIEENEWKVGQDLNNNGNIDADEWIYTDWVSATTDALGNYVYTFTGLKANTEYYIRTQCSDNSGSTTIISNNKKATTDSLQGTTSTIYENKEVEDGNPKTPINTTTEPTSTPDWTDKDLYVDLQLPLNSDDTIKPGIITTITVIVPTSTGSSETETTTINVTNTSGEIVTPPTTTTTNGTTITANNEDVVIKPTTDGVYKIIITTTDGGNTTTDTKYVYVDKTAPTTTPTVENKTTNSVTINSNAQDATSGVKQITYVLKDSEGTVVDTITYTAQEGQTLNSEDTKATFTGLKDNQTYTVEVTVKDNSGNETTPSPLQVTTTKLTAGTLTFTEKTDLTSFNPQTTEPTAENKVWINDDIRTHLEKGNEGTSGSTVYVVTAPGGAQTTYTIDDIILTQEGDYTVTVITKDGEGAGANEATRIYYFSVDKTAPVIEITPNTRTYTIPVEANNTNVNIKLTVTDNASGVATTTQYAFSNSTSTEPTAWENFTNDVTMTPTLNGGEYYLWTKVEDKAGNRAVIKNTSVPYSSDAYNIGYAIEFDTNGGSTIASARKIHGTNYTLSSVPTKANYIFKGWATASNSTTVAYTKNSQYTTDAPIKLYAVWAEEVASTNINGTITVHETVQDAIDYAEGNVGAVVTLLKNEITESIKVNAGQNIILDLNGKHLTYENTTTVLQTIENNGNLTIRDSGENGEVSGSWKAINNSGNLVINGGKVSQGTVDSGDFYGVILNKNNGTLEINGGYLLGADAAILGESTGDIVINGGKIESTQDNAIYSYNNNTGKITVNDGELIAPQNNSSIYSEQNTEINIYGGTLEGRIFNNANVTIDGATVKITGYIGINVGGGTLTIKQGTIIATNGIGVKIDSNGKLILGTDDSTVSTTKPEIIGSTQGIKITSGTFEFYDGIIKAPTGNTIDGTVTKTPTGYRPINGTTVIAENNSYGITPGTYETAYLDNHYELTLNTNEGTLPNKENWTISAGTATTVVEYGKNIPQAPVPTKTGYTFDGYYTQPNGAGTQYFSNTGNALQPVDFTEDITLYAKWTPNSNTAYTVYHYIEKSDATGFDLNETESKTGTTDSTITISSLIKTTGAYADYQSYATLSSNSNDTHITATTVQPDGQRKIYIYYVKSAYVIHYENIEGATFTTENPTSYTKQTPTITLVNPTKTGYTFAGWTGTGLSQATTDVTIPQGSSGERTYTATWTVNQYKVTYNYGTNGGQVSESNSATVVEENVAYGSEINATAKSAYKQNYTFIGWSESSTDRSEIISTNPIMGTSPVTLYAMYSKEVTVTYNKNGGNTDITQHYTMYNNETAITLTTPEPTTFANWTFNGYATTAVETNSANLTAQNTQKTITVAQNSTNFDMYHTWKRTITFNANKPTSAEPTYNVTLNETSRTVYYGNNGNKFGALPTNPILQGWNFTGWYTSPTAGTQVTATTSTTNTTQLPAQIYAHWTLTATMGVSSNNVTLDLSEENPNQTVTITGSNQGNITYTIGDETKVTVTPITDVNGKITGIQITPAQDATPGDTTVTITGSNGVDPVVITVHVIRTPQSISIADNALIGKETGTNQTTLTPTILPANTTAQNTYTYVSNDETVATVNSTTGVVTGIKDGTAQITVTTANGKEDTCNVTVDGTAPQVSISMDGTDYAKTHTATVTIEDKTASAESTTPVAGLPATQTIKYAWTTSNQTAPTSEQWQDKTVTTTAGNKKVSITINSPTDITGERYLWIKSGIKDRFNNQTTSNVVSDAIKFDNTKPVISKNGNATPQKASSNSEISIPLKITDEVNGLLADSFTTDDLIIKVGGNVIDKATLQTLQLTKTGNNNGEYTYTLTLKGVTGEGELTIEIPANSVSDKAGNTNNATQISTGVTMDSTAFSCTITANKTSPTNANSITYTFKFNKPVTGFDATDIEVTNGTKGTFTTKSTTEFELVVTNSGTCTQTVDVTTASCEDASGNKLGDVTPLSIRIDRTAPSNVDVTVRANSETGTEKGTVSRGETGTIYTGVANTYLTFNAEDTEGNIVGYKIGETLEELNSSSIVNVANITAIPAGKTYYIKAVDEAGNVSANATIVTVKLVTLSITTATNTVENEKTLQLETNGQNNTPVTWTSSNTQIATVDANTGVVTGKKVGQVTITATAGTDTSVTATKIINVTKGKVAKPTAVTGLIYNGSEQTGVTPATNSKYTYSSTYKATDAGNYTATATLNDTTNYEWVDGTIVPLNIDWQIAPKTLTATASAQEKTYDGTTNVIGGNISLTGVEAGDIGKVSATGTYVYDAVTVGTRTINVHVTSLQGERSSNYVLSEGSVDISTSSKINPATLTATLTVDNSKVYDATTTANNASITLSGIVEGDNGKVTATASSCTYDNKNVGTNKTVTASGITLDGEKASNYTLEQTTATTTANITPRTLTVKFEDTSFTQGETVDLNSSITVEGFQGEDRTNPAVSAGYVAPTVSSNPTAPGTYTITPTGGSVNSNYTFNRVSGTLTINANANFNVSISPTSVVYNGTAQTVTVTVTDKTTGNVIDSSNYSVEYDDNTDVGTASVTVTMNGVNYTGSTVKNFNITRADRTITPINKMYIGKNVSKDVDISYSGETVQIENSNISATTANIVTLTGGSNNKITVRGTNVGKTVVNVTVPESANYNEATATFEVIVTDFSLSPTTDTITDSTSVVITPIISRGSGTTANEEVNITWTTSNSSIATISSNTTIGEPITVTGVSDGTVTITATLNGQSKTVTITVASNYEEVTSGGAHVTYYETLKNALANVTTGNTIKPLKNTTETTTATLESDKTAIIDLNGKTIKSTVCTISNEGTLTICGTGKIIATQDEVACINNLSEGTITVGTNEAGEPQVSTEEPCIIGGSYGINGMYGEVNFYDGIIKGRTNAIKRAGPPIGTPRGYSVKNGTEEISAGNGYDLPVGTYKTAYLSNVYTVTVNPNGGKFINTSNYNSELYELLGKYYCFDVEYGSNKNANIIFNNTSIERSGYTFEGLYTRETGGTQIYGQYYRINGTTYWSSEGKWEWDYDSNVMLYAHWTENLYSLKVNPNGGLYDGMDELLYLMRYSDVESISTPTRTGYAFAGWKELSNGLFNDPSFASGTNGNNKYNLSEGTTVTVTRQAKSAYNVIGDYELKITNDGTAETSPGLGGFVNAVTSEANKKYIHVFVAKLPVGYYFHNANNEIGNGGTTKWLTPQEGTGSFKTYAYEVDAGNTGTFQSFGHVYISRSITNTFDKRYSETGAVTAYLAYSNIFDITSDDTGFGMVDGTGQLTAQWIENSGTIRYYPNGGTIKTGTSYELESSGEYEGSCTSTTPVIYRETTKDVYNCTTLFERKGYHIPSDAQAWRKDSPTSTTYVNQASHDFSQYLANDTGIVIKLYANWVPDTYTVTLDNQGATTAGTQTAYYQYSTTKEIGNVTCYYYNDSATTNPLTGGNKITKPTKTGYQFGGYYTETGGAGIQYINADGNFVNDLYKTIGNVTLYAHWIARLIINPAGGSYNGNTSNTVINQENTTTYSVLNNPIRPGYTFNGWTLSGAGTYNAYDQSSTANETRTFNYNSASSTLPSAYNNANNNTVTCSMVADSTGTGGYSLKVVTNGIASPGAGGIKLVTLPTDAGRINVLQIRAKIPIGYNLVCAGISEQYTGLGSACIIVGNSGSAGTGNWETYNIIYYKGDTGYLSTTAHLNLNGTNNKSVTWNVDSIVMKSYTRAQFKSIYTFGEGTGTLTANWKVGGARVTFNTNGGEWDSAYVANWNVGYNGVSSTSAYRFYTYNRSYGTFPSDNSYDWTPDNRVISRPGYTFAGWYTAASGGTKIFNADGTLVNSVGGYSDANGKWIKYDQNVEVYAQWTANTYKLATLSNNLLEGEQLVYDKGESSVSNGLYTLKNTVVNSGYYIPESLLESQKTYLLTYKLKKKAGTLDNIGGHSHTGITKLFKIDSIDSTQPYHTPGGNMTDDTNTHTIQYLFRYDDTVNTTQKNIYIQPNRSCETEVTVEIWDVELREVYTESNKVYGTNYTSTEIANKTRTGYTFKGWYANSESNTKLTTTTAFNTTTATFADAAFVNGSYAYIYEKSNANLTINPMGGSYNGTTSNTIIDQPVGTTYSVLNNPTKTGYTFTGWTLSGAGSYNAYDSSSTATETTTFNYNSSSSTLPVVYNNANNGTVTCSMVADSTGTGGYSLKVATNGTASPGAGGINLVALSTEEGRINVLQIRAKIPIGYNLVCAGISEQYTGFGSACIIVGNSGSAGTGNWETYNIIYYKGDTGHLSTTAHLNLNGTNNKSVTWNIDSIVSKSYTRAQFKSIYTFGKGAGTLTANWKVGGAKVTFNTNGGEWDSNYVANWNVGYNGVSSTSAYRFYTYNRSYGTFPSDNSYDWTPDNRVISRPGYTFTGWYTAASGGTKIFNADGTLVKSLSGYSDANGKWIKYDQNVEVYAQWTVNSYTLTANANGGTIPSTTGWTVASGSATATKSVTYASTYGTLPTPTRTDYTFIGWYTATTGGTKVTSNTTVSTASAITIYAQWAKYEELNGTTHVAYYGTLAEAMSGVTSGNTIMTLHEDSASSDATLPSGVTATLNINSKTIHMNGSRITNNGTLTITGAGTLIGYSRNLIINTGTLTKSGTSEISHTLQTGLTYAIKNIGTVTINEGTISSRYSAIINEGNKKVIVNGGTINGYSFAIRNEAAGTIQITGGTITGNNGNSSGVGILNSAGTIQITGGTIYGYVDGIYMNKGNGILTIGTNDGSVSTTTPSIASNCHAVYVDNDVTEITGQFNFYDGKLVSERFPNPFSYGAAKLPTSVPSGYTVQITSLSSGSAATLVRSAAKTASLASFSLKQPEIESIDNELELQEENINNEKTVSVENLNEDKTNITNTNVNEIEEDEKIEQTEEIIEIKITNKAQIGKTQYETLQQAIDSASNGNTIKILEDISLEKEVTIPKGKQVTIDLNGKTITSTSINTINNKGTLTISSMGIIKNEVQNGNVIYNTGTLNIKNGIITTALDGGKGIYNDAGTINMEAGKVVTEGKGAFGIYNMNESKLNIKGGIIEVTEFGSTGIYNDSKVVIGADADSSTSSGTNSSTNAKSINDENPITNTVTITISAEGSTGIYNTENAKEFIIKDTEIIIEADEIKNYEKIKNTDQFKEELAEMKQSYAIRNYSKTNVTIETATIKVERLKGVGIENNSEGSIILGKNDEEYNSASPIIYAISDNTTAFVKNGKGEIGWYDGRVLTKDVINVTTIFDKILDKYEITKEHSEKFVTYLLSQIKQDDK